MALPKIKHPIFELTVPSTKEQIKYRPFLVKEEKILLLAQQSKEVKDMIEAVKQIINNCVVEGSIDIDKLPSFDIEYIFLQLRANSVGQTAKLAFTDQDTNKRQEVEVDLTKVNVKWEDNHKDIIQITDNIKMSMKYPTYADIAALDLDKINTAEQTMKMVRMCSDKVYSGEDQVDQLSDYSEQEVDEFLESLNTQNFADVQLFFETMPKLSHTIEYTIGKKNKNYTFQGIADFFSFA